MDEKIRNLFAQALPYRILVAYGAFRLFVLYFGDFIPSVTAYFSPDPAALPVAIAAIVIAIACLYSSRLRIGVAVAISWLVAKCFVLVAAADQFDRERGLTSLVKVSQKEYPPITGREIKLWVAGSIVTGALCLALLVCMVHALDNTTDQTTNGLWKARNLSRWMMSGRGIIEPANLIYFPVIGRLMRWLHAFDHMLTISQLIAYTNCLFCAFGMSCFFATICLLCRKPAVAAWATAFHTSCAFVLLLSTISEDIMPAYSFYLAALLCVVATTKSRSLVFPICAGVFYCLCWEMHWTMLIPASIPLLLGVLVASESSRRMRTLGAFVGAGLVMLICAHIVYSVDIRGLLLPSKASGNNWVGWSADKLAFLWDGIGQYGLHGSNVALLGDILRAPFVVPNLLTWAIIIVLATALLVRRGDLQADRGWFAVFVVTIGTFLLGELENVYSQPQDPQMQIQPMAWLPFAFGYVAALKNRTNLAVAIRAASAAVLVGMLVYNLSVRWEHRGEDSNNMASLAELAAAAPPEHSVFVALAFEPFTSWAEAYWHKRDYRIVYIRQGINDTESTKGAIDSLLSEVTADRKGGRQVVATAFWSQTPQAAFRTVQTIDHTGRTVAIVDAFHSRFDVRSVFQAGNYGRFYRLTPRLDAPGVKESKRQ